MIHGVDTSWPQGPHVTFTSGARFVIVGSSTGDGGSLLAFTSTPPQIDRARAAGLKVGHYFYNGGDPAAAAAFFVKHLHDFRSDEDVLALDLEGKTLWTPAQALTWCEKVQKLTGIPAGRLLIYMNENVNAHHDWSPLVEKGYPLWYARPTGDPNDQAWWKSWAMRQTGVAGGIDQDEADPAFFSEWGGKGTPAVAGAVASPSTVVGYNMTSRPTVDVQRLVGAKPDGIYLTETTAKVKAWQKAHGLTADGIWGPKSDAKGFPKKTTKPKSKRPSVAPKTPPRYPLPAGSYFGPEGGPVQSVSGWHGHRDDVKRAQQQLHDRGYSLAVDGYYSAKGATNPSASVTGRTVGAFQKDKGLKVDYLLGPTTWNAMWEEPVT